MPTYDGIGETITHKLEIEGDLFLQDVEGGPNSTQVPLEIFSQFQNSPNEVKNSRMLRLRVQNAGESNVSNSYVTDFGIRGEADKDYFFITAPQNTSNVGDQNTFVISKTSNVGIGTTDPGHYRLLVNNSSTKHFGVPGNDTPTTGDTLVYNENGEWVYSFPAGNLPAGSVDNEILTWNGANWVPNRSIRTTNSNTAIGIGTYEPLANLHVIGSVTATSDVDISGKFQGGRLRVGSVLSPDPTNPNVTVPGDLTVSGTLTSDEWIHTSNLDITGNIHVDHDFLIDGTYQGTGMRLDGTLHNLSGAIPDLSVAGSITATGDIKTDQTFRGTDASITGTLTTSNITHGSELTVTTNLLMGPGTTLTASNIVGASPVTISSSIVMAAGTTLTTAAIEPPTGAESNLKITGTITTSNIVANTGDSLLVSSNLEVGTSNLFVDTSTGRVGIGTTSPVAPLHVSSDNTTLDAVDSATIDQYSLILHNTRGGGANGTEIGLCFNNYDSSYPTSSYTPGAAITHERVSSWSYGKLHFKTKRGTESVSECTTAMTIDQTGNVGIGTTSPGNTLHVNGDSKMNRIFTEGVNYTGFSEFSWTNTANIGTGHVCGLLSISSTSGGNRSMYVVTQNTSGTDFVLLSGGGYTVQKSGDYIQVKTTINYFTVSYWSWIRLL